MPPGSTPPGPPPQWPPGQQAWQAGAGPPGQQWPGYAPPQAAPSNGLHIAALVCGIIGIVLGVIPLFFFLSIPLGIIAVVLGFIAHGRAKRVGIKQGRAGIVLGFIAIALGIVGLVIVSSAFDDLDEDLDCIDNADTPAELEACNTD